MKPVKTPNYEDLIYHGNISGDVNYRGQNFKFVYSHQGGNQWLFVFDPQTDGMTLTNAADFVLEQIFNQLLREPNFTIDLLKDFLNESSSILLRDSNGEWSKVQVALTWGQNRYVTFVCTGALVKKWDYFEFSEKFFELFKLLR